MRNHGDPKSRASIGTPCHREADAIDSNTGFFTDVPAIGGISPAQLEIPGLAKGFDAHHLADAVDMTTHEMSAKAIRQAEGWLQIDRTARRGFASECAALQRFLADIGEKSITDQCRHRETDAIDGNAVPQLKGSERSAATHDEATAAAFNPTNSLH